MREEKKYLVQEVDSYLEKSDYAILTDFERITVSEVADLRASLAEQEAEFHVVKNRIFKVAAQGRNLPDVSDHLKGSTAIVVGGKNPSEVAKIVKKFHKQKEKVGFKVGFLNGSLLDAAQLSSLAELPSMDELRAQLLSVLSAPASQLVRVINGVPQAMVNVLKAKADKG